MDSQISNSGNTVDEAQEKLFGDNNSNTPKIEIKFVTDPKNGDTKIDMSDIRQVFVGMGKDELMKFANDPFWVRMRWFLFILFWILWLGMLAGALAIILLAPKCDSPSPSKWYQESPIYHVNVKNFMDSNDDGVGDLKGMESKLEYFKDLGVDTILLDSLMLTAPGTDDVTDFTAINSFYGSLEDLKRLLAAAKTKGLHFLMSFIPNFSSSEHEWFKKSVAREDPFTDYYVWSKPNYEEGAPKPINNWLSVTNGSAWEWNADRKEFYLHQFEVNQPDLNFRHPEVVKYFKTVCKFWLDLGFNGLHLDKVEYLIEDINLANETISSEPGKTHDEYDFLSHSKTKYLPESLSVSSQWAEVFQNYSSVFSVSGIHDGENSEQVDLISRPIELSIPYQPNVLLNVVRNHLNKASQMWMLHCKERGGCDQNILTGLEAVILMLPGAAVIPSGLELGIPPYSIIPWNSDEEHLGFSTVKPWKSFDSKYNNRSVALEIKDEHSFYNTFKRIIKERRTPIVMHGSTYLTLINSSVLAFTRSKSGSPQYLVALNLDQSHQTVNLQEAFKGIPEKLTLIASSSNFLPWWHDTADVKTNMLNAKLEMPGGSFAILLYIADAEEE